MKPRERERWGKVRAKGRVYFVAIYGVLAWGLCVALSWSVFMEAWDAGFSIHGFVAARFVGRAEMAVIAFPLGGIFFGPWAWWYNERRYRRTDDCRNDGSDFAERQNERH